MTEKLKIAITEVFANRKTPLKYPIAFTSAFYDTKETQQRWSNFLSSMGKDYVHFKDVILEISNYLELNFWFT